MPKNTNLNVGSRKTRLEVERNGTSAGGGGSDDMELYARLLVAAMDDANVAFFVLFDLRRVCWM